MGRNDTFLLVFLVGFFGGELLGSFDGVFDGVLGWCIVYFDADIVLTAAFMALVHNALDFEGDFLVVFLSPVDEFALEVPVSMGHCIDIKVDVDYFIDKDAAGELVTFFKIDGTYKSLEGIAVDGFKDTLRDTVVLDKLGEAYFLSQFVEVGPADEFGTHFGEESFSLVGIFFVKKFGHDSAKNSIAEVFETFIIDTPTLPSVDRLGLVDESYLIERDVVGSESQSVFEEKIKIFVFPFVAMEMEHGQYLRKARQALCPPKPNALLRAKSTRRWVGLLKEKSSGGMLGSSVKWLIVGGIMSFLTDRTVAIASITLAAPRRWPVIDFVELSVILLA